MGEKGRHISANHSCYSLPPTDPTLHTIDSHSPKVWLAEKSHDEEQKRLAELQKQIAEVSMPLRHLYNPKWDPNEIALLSKHCFFAMGVVKNCLGEGNQGVAGTPGRNQRGSH